MSALGFLPCPFCGSHAGFRFGNDGEVVNVRCSNWGRGCMGAGSNEYSREKAREAWNHRSPDRASIMAAPDEARAESLRDSLRLDWCQRHAVGIENTGSGGWMVFGDETGSGKTLREAIDEAARRI